MQTQDSLDSSYTQMTNDDAVQAVTLFMTSLGFAPETPGLRGTPLRMVRMYAEEFFRPPENDWTIFPSETTSMIVQSDVSFVAICEHHFIPFYGTATVAYIPRKKMVGLSKLSRCVEYHARSAPTVQERMAEAIADEIDHELEPLGVGVCLDAEHLCMTIRGIHKPGARTRVTAVRGALLEEPAAREEFLHAIR